MIYLINLPPWLFTLFVALTTSGLAVIGLLLMRKYLPKFYVVSEDNAFANIALRQISTVLAVVLAFAVITIWNNYELQREHTGTEASLLGNMYRDSRGLRPDVEKEVQKLITIYTSDLVTDGWPSMAEGRESRVAWLSFNKLYGKVIRFMPENPREEIVYTKMIDNLNELAKFRRLRQIRNANPLIPQILWITIYSGTVLILISGYFLRTSKVRMQITLTAINGLMLGLIFSMMLLLNYPYRGSLQISSYPLENLLKDVFPMAEVTTHTPQPDTLNADSNNRSMN